MQTLPKKRPIAHAAVAALLLTCLGGCSLLFVRPPPPPQLWDRIGWARCTQSKAWPVVDTIFAISSAAVVMMPFLDPDPAFGDDNTQLIANSIQLAGWAFSAYYGFKTTDNCRAFWLHQMQRRGGYPGAGPAQRPQHQPPPQQAPPPTAPPAQQPPQQPQQPQGNDGVLEPPPATNAPPSAPQS